MEQISQYRIVYVESAIRDIEEKADYISVQFHDPSLAERWYLSLRTSIQKHLTTFPHKFLPYNFCREILNIYKEDGNMEMKFDCNSALEKINFINRILDMRMKTPRPDGKMQFTVVWTHEQEKQFLFWRDTGEDPLPKVLEPFQHLGIPYTVTKSSDLPQVERYNIRRFRTVYTITAETPKQSLIEKLYTDGCTQSSELVAELSKQLKSEADIRLLQHPVVQDIAKKIVDTMEGERSYSDRALRPSLFIDERAIKHFCIETYSWGVSLSQDSNTIRLINNLESIDELLQVSFYHLGMKGLDDAAQRRAFSIALCVLAASELNRRHRKMMFLPLEIQEIVNCKIRDCGAVIFDVFGFKNGTVPMEEPLSSFY